MYLQVRFAGGQLAVGGAEDPIYTGWSKILGFGAGAGLPVNFAFFPPAVGAPVLRDFTLVKTTDAATTQFAAALVRGTIIESFQMVVVQRGPSRVEFWDMVATDCIFTSQDYTGASDGDEMIEKISIRTNKLEWRYTTVLPSGRADKEIFTLARLAEGPPLSGVRAPDSLGDRDSDGDGLPDGWEAFYGLDLMNPYDAALDTDGDGMSNFEEFLAHTDPTSANSVLRVTALQGQMNGSFAMTWHSVPGVTYRILAADSPAGPFNLVRTVPSGGTTTTVTNLTGPPGAYFFRVAIP